MTVRGLALSVVVVVAACAGRDAEVSDAGSPYVNPDCAVEVDIDGCGTSSGGRQRTSGSRRPPRGT
jgi:hypothetical protein